MSEIKLPDEIIDKHLDAILRASGSTLRHYSLPTSLSKMRAAMADFASAAVELDRAGRDGAEKELAYLRVLVSRVVSEADTDPFNPIGFVVEHVVPELRDCIASQSEECTHCGGFGEVTGESPGFACPACNGTGETCTGTIGSVPELFDCGNCNGTGKSAKPAEQQAQCRPLTDEQISDFADKFNIYEFAHAIERYYGIGEQAQRGDGV